MEDNLDPAEISKFNALAEDWWNLKGGFGLLHKINPFRLDFIDTRARLDGKKVLDIGCGGGILSEGLARRGAHVTGIDMAENPLMTARRHAAENLLEINYRRISVEALSAERPGMFDVVTCMEMLEHIPNPSSVVNACAMLAKPGGSVFFSTLNRTFKAYALAIVGGEYILGLIARGTHKYSKLITPDELAAWCRGAGLAVSEQCGVIYQPLRRTFRLDPRDLSINYITYCRRE